MPDNENNTLLRTAALGAMLDGDDGEKYSSDAVRIGETVIKLTGGGYRVKGTGRDLAGDEITVAGGSCTLRGDSVLEGREKTNIEAAPGYDGGYVAVPRVLDGGGKA